MSGMVPGSIRMRWPRPASLTWRIARATESGSYSTPTSSVAGNRRATAISHLPPPQATSRTRAPRLRFGDELGQLGEPFLEEHGDVLDRDRFDGSMESRRTLVDRPSGPEELRQTGIVEAGDHGNDELSAEVLRVGIVQEHRDDVVREPRAVVFEGDQVAGVGGSDPGSDGLGPATGGGCQGIGRDALGAGRADPLEESQLQAQVDDPAPVEAPRPRRPAPRTDRRVPWSADCRTRANADAVPPGGVPARRSSQRSAGWGCFIGRWRSNRRTTAPSRRGWRRTSTRRSRRSSLAHQDRLFTIAFRTGGDRHDAEELVQDCFVRAYRALATYPPARIRELRLRGWLTTILLNAGRNRARVRRVPTAELAFEPGAEPAVDPLAPSGRARDLGPAAGGIEPRPADGRGPPPRRRDVIRRDRRGDRPARGHRQGPCPSRPGRTAHSASRRRAARARGDPRMTRSIRCHRRGGPRRPSRARPRRTRPRCARRSRPRRRLRADGLADRPAPGRLERLGRVDGRGVAPTTRRSRPASSPGPGAWPDAAMRCRPTWPARSSGAWPATATTGSISTCAAPRRSSRPSG